MTTSTTATVVIPCHNESMRLTADPILELALAADAQVLLVDDGSTDDTAGLLHEWTVEHPRHLQALSLPQNVGKGEAVRAGLRHAVHSGATIVAFCDADFATPAPEVARLVGALREDTNLDAVLGSRVAILGSEIDRSPFRHYTGRLFATAAAIVLGVPVYDTQCGAKAFRSTPTLRRALSDPFVSRWAFDVELLGRLLNDAEVVISSDDSLAHRLIELPLKRWAEPGGSRFSLSSRARTTLELAAIGWRLRRR